MSLRQTEYVVAPSTAAEKSEYQTQVCFGIKLHNVQTGNIIKLTKRCKSDNLLLSCRSDKDMKIPISLSFTRCMDLNQ